MKESYTTGIIMMVIVTVVSSMGQLLLKMGMADFVLERAYLNVFLIGGVLLYAISAILLILALRHGPLSSLFPFMALTFIWVLLLSWFVLHEPLTGKEAAGICLVTIGVAVVGGASR